MADHPNASPTAARGVTGLPTLAEVEAQINEFLIANSDSVVAHHDGTESEESLEQRRIALYPLRAKVKATLRTLLSAAEQGERDREDAERFRGLEQFVVGITTRCSDGYEEDYERDDLPDEDGEEFREWIDFMLKNSRANEADAARQPRQEGDRNG